MLSAKRRQYFYYGIVVLQSIGVSWRYLIQFRLSLFASRGSRNTRASFETESLLCLQCFLNVLGLPSVLRDCRKVGLCSAGALLH